MRTYLIVDIIIACLSLPVWFMVFRYNLHMFQLNGYKPKEHFSWMKKNRKKEALLAVLTVIGILGAFFKCVPVYVVEVILLYIVFRYFLFWKKFNIKKKLVYTKRVKRLVVTDTVLSLALVAAGYLLFDGRFSITAVCLYIAAQFFMVLICNFINMPIEKSINRYYLNDAKRILRSNPDLTVIGVTGSFGKTSMKYYLNTLLSEHFSVLITPESFNTPLGVIRTIREHMNSKHRIFICEMGARHVGDIKELCDIVHPKHGVITSVGPQHLETFFNIENIVNTKFELADALPKDGMLILNGDNELIRNNAGKYPGCTFYSTKEKDGYYACDIKLSNMGTEFTVVTPDKERESFSMRLIGEHNVINVLGAISIANRLGVPLKSLKLGVRRLRPVAHRLQLLERGNISIIDDAYNSNPVGSKMAVETLKSFPGIRILVTPGMVELGDREEEFNYKFGTYAADCCDYILLIGKKHTKPIWDGVMSMNFNQDNLKVFEKLEDAMNFVYGIKSDEHKYVLLENDLPDNY